MFKTSLKYMYIEKEVTLNLVWNVGDITWPTVSYQSLTFMWCLFDLFCVETGWSYRGCQQCLTLHLIYLFSVEDKLNSLAKTFLTSEYSSLDIVENILTPWNSLHSTILNPGFLGPIKSKWHVSVQFGLKTCTLNYNHFKVN